MRSRLNELIFFVLIVITGWIPVSLAQDAGQGSGSVININVSRSIQAINYRSRGTTKVDFAGTPLLPKAEGLAKVESRGGDVVIDAEFKGLSDPGTFESGYVVYVLWALTPEGHANNLGQIVVKDQKAEIQATTKLQTFGMMVTAEPYFAVPFPSNSVVLENRFRNDTKGGITMVDTKLLERGDYKGAGLQTRDLHSKVPVDLYQARNAVQIAQWEQADKYAPDSFAKAQQDLAQAEEDAKHKKSAVPMAARTAVQAAEDARVLAVKHKQEQEAADAQKAAQEAQAAEQRRAAQAQEAAAQQAQARAEAEAAAAQQAQARSQAEQQAQQEAAARAAAQQQAQQEAAARASAEQQAQRNQQAAAQAEQDKEQLRSRLLQQFNQVLPTTDTPRGLVVNMQDVLFDTGKADLRPAAREALARLSGIVANYPSLELTVEGHTDSTGSEELNLVLSQKRADEVRAYLINQGVKPDDVQAKGLGKSDPVADNATASGRQRNRRVEIIVAGDVIGTPVGANPGAH